MTGETSGEAGPMIVLIGLMGVGKSSVGRRLAARLKLPFLDADTEIEKAAGRTIEDIFEIHGEAHFRKGERRVIARLLSGPTCVLAAGGGAFLDPDTRALIRERGISIWLEGGLDLLVARVSRRPDRPLLKRGEPRDVLAKLIEERYPIYAEADLKVEVKDEPIETTVERVAEALAAYQKATPASPRAAASEKKIR
ncbi:MAG: shikimate kinase [Alphaproteobacteria bacterium]|nr:shikimate kinase [Alphaproteobacteria bacterium]